MGDKRLKMDNTLLQVTVKWTWLDVACRNVLYFKKKDLTAHLEDGDFSGWDDVKAADCANRTVAEIGGSLLSLLHISCSLDSADWVWNESTVTPVLHAGSSDAGLGGTGTQTGESMPTFTSLAVHLGTGLAGRANNGRMYLPGINDGLIDGPDYNHIKPGSMADFSAALGALKDALVGNGVEDLVGDGFNQYWQVASFFEPGSTAGNLTGTLRDPTVSHTVVQAVLKDDVIDTMNSRKLGRGV